MKQQYITVDIVRDDGHVSRHQVEHEDYLTVARILSKIYLEQDRALAYRHYCCNIARCVSCLIKVNGNNVHACKHVVEAGAEIRLEAADGGKVIRDLVCGLSSSGSQAAFVRTLEI